jgi:steroid 5-alpha reductase family enzyme
MSQAERTSLVALPVVLLVAAGVALAGSQGGQALAGIPVFAVGFALAFVIQWIAFIPAYLNQTEKFFDLTGSLTYLTVMVVAVLLAGAFDVRSLLLLALVIIWAVRLGSFLFRRIQRAGVDERFDDIKPSFLRFLLTWTLQGLWVSLTLAAALAALTSADKPGFDALAVFGLVVWLLGFGIEVTADRQKKLFRENPENKGRFINTGLWSWSRHPNYFGEIVLWVGVAIIAIPVMSGWQYVTLISPLFVILLLTRVSGIPMLEKRADEKWGGQADYEAYKARTSVLVPVPPGSAE